MSLRQTVPPATSPVTLAEAKRHLRLEDTTDQDEQIQGFLDSAIQLIEEAYWLQLITATWELKLDGFREEVIYAPRGPLQSATIEYVDGAGATQTFSNVTVDTSSFPGRITPAYGYSWPSTRCHINAVTVEMVNGFGDSANEIPQPIKQSVLIYAGILFESRGGCGSDMPPVIDALMSPYRMTYARGTVA